MPLPYEISDMCKKCIMEHKKKKKEFKVSCIPVPKEMEDKDNPIYPLDKILGLSNYLKLPESIKIDLQLEKNVLLWAKECLGWTPYNKARDFYQWYQKEFLLCNAQNKVLRFGRRLGKCIHEDTLITTANRGPVKAKELNSNDELITFNEKTGEVFPTNNWYMLDNGVKDCLKVKTRTGKIDYVTTNHPYLVIRNKMPEWIEAKDLSIGDRVAVPKNYKNTFDKYEKQEFDYEKYKLLGYLIADGGTNYKTTCRFTNFNPITVLDIKNILKKYNCHLSRYAKGNYGITKNSGKFNNVVNLVREYNMQSLAINKKIPEQIFKSSKKNLSYFISGMYDCDGWISRRKKGIQIGYCSASKDLIEGLKHLLIRFGIHGVITERKVKYKGEYNNKAYILSIDNLIDAYKFQKEIPLLSKKDKLDNILSEYQSVNSKLTTIPKSFLPFLKQKIKDKKESLNKYGFSMKNCYDPSLEKLERINEKIKLEELDYLLNSDFLFDEIKSIEDIGKSQTYAVTVPETHTFVTNDIITHNTEGLTVEILHRGWTNNSSDKPILIIGPYQNLIDEIFDRLDSLLSGPDSIFKGKFTRKRQPNEITLSNGIKIKGFTTGTDGNSIRGQSAQAVYLDECAYIPQEAFKAIMAFKLDNPNVTFRAASTPSMVETNFKNWCTTDKNWHDFWCPSTILPNFKEKDEPELRASLTEDGYKLEVEAKFIEGSARVFKSHNINNAKSKYNYINSRSELNNPNDWYITIGTDWNENLSGVQIVVLGFNFKSGEKKPFKVLNRISMHGDYSGVRTKNLQTAGVEKIKQLHEAFKADFVYVDQGHGSMQAEVLSEYFYRRNEIHKFKAVDFASNYDIEDIYTGEIRHKRRKVMMVYFLQKRFELEEILISELEEQGKGLMIDQLMMYNIVRYDSKGQPIFEGEDHILDALMLATFAFIENYDSIFDRKTGMFVAGFTNKLGRFKDEFNSVPKEPALLTEAEVYMHDKTKDFYYSSNSLREVENGIKKVQGVYSLSRSRRKRTKRGGFDFDIF